MESKHSPAPWSIDELVQCSIHSGDKYIALINDANHFSSGERKANAYLISAAPELLEALQRLLKYHDDFYGIEPDEDPEHPLAVAKAAIAKALGKQ